MRTNRRRTRPSAGQVAEGLGALCVVVASLVGIPIILATLIGWPLPHHLPTLVQMKTDFTTQIPDAFWPKFFACLGWIAWAYFVFSVASNLVTQIRVRRRHGADRFATVRLGAHGIAGALITAILLLSQVRATPSAPGFSPTPVVQVIAAPPAASPPATAATQPAEVVHTVVEGESLWEIAVAYYGNGEMWKEIAATNRGVRQFDGRALHDAHWIYPGWQLVIPNAPAAGPLTPVVRGVPGLRPIAVRTGAVTPSSQPSPAPNAPAVPSAVRPQGSVADHAPRRITSDHPDHTADHAKFRLHAPELPEIVIACLGLLAAAVIGRSLVRRRQVARISLRPGEMCPASSPQIRDLESALASLTSNPEVDWLDLAMRHLTEVDRMDPGSVPPVRLVRVGSHGVDLILGRAAGVAPAPFCVAEDGWAWTLASATRPGDLADTPKTPAWLSALVPIGTDDDGQTYLAPVEPGTVLPVTGHGACEVAAAMATTATSWSWADHVTVTSDAAVATRAFMKPSTDPRAARDRVIYVGLPTDVAPEIAAAIGILTTDAVAATDLSVACDTDGNVEIVPTQLHLRACRLTPDAQAAVAGAIATAETPPSTEVPVHRVVVKGLHGSGAGNGASPPGDPTQVQASSEVELEVRVLTNTPVLVATGAGAAPIKLADRHLGLLALLALNNGLTKEQLRRSIYEDGSSVGNISRLASELRSALGTDTDGNLFLPDANAGGVLTLSDRVAVDLTRLGNLVDAGRRADYAAAIDLYRSGLDLIEATPGSPIGHTWSWWSRYADIAGEAAVVAACELARLTIDTGGDFDAARVGITRARALSPYAEELYQAAIELAGATGNLRWAQREWVELLRMLDDFGPGRSPKPETEAAYNAVLQSTRPLTAAR